MLFGWHESATYENIHKMTPSQVMLWCQPNDKLAKNKDFTKNAKRWKQPFGLDQISEKNHNNKKLEMTVLSRVETRRKVFKKGTISSRQNLAGADQEEQQ